MFMSSTGRIVSALVFLALAVQGRRPPADDKPAHDPRAQAMYHYGDYSQELKMYTIELSSKPVVVEHPKDYRDRHQRHHRHVLDYERYLVAQQDAIVTQLERENAQMVTSFQYVFNGVTMMMTDAQADEMRTRSDVVRVWEEGFYDLLDQRPGATTTTTTHNNNNKDNRQRILAPLTHRGKLWANDLGLTGEDVVIGVLDSGIVPENDSFKDEPSQGNNPQSYGPAPSSFTGTGCAFGDQKYNRDDQPFTCQGKILAAKCYAKNVSQKFGDKYLCGGDGARLKEEGHFLSARDDDGHGTHVASTAAGNAGVEAMVNGEVKGIIQGVAPRARLSVYKVCWEGGCGSIDTLAALEDVVKDNVDVINYSIGGTVSRSTDVAFLNLLQTGIVPVAAGGNAGPDPSTLSFPAAYPWMVGVAASGDPHGTALVLEVRSPIGLEGTYEASTSNGGIPATPSNIGSFAGQLVAVEPHMGCSRIDEKLNGKVALIIRGECTFEEKINNANAAGAKAVIIYNDGTKDDRMGLVSMHIAGTTQIPAIFLEYERGKAVKESLDAGVQPVFSVKFVSNEKTVAGFSSRGPNNRFTANVIKPDIIAPGMDVLAAEAPLMAGVDGVKDDFGYKDGTSMASPHIAGFMALMKEAFPSWSPSALKSAMMTTARQDIRETLLAQEIASPLLVGSGFPVINNALDPGLIYEITMDEYRAVYCGFDEDGVGRKDCEDLKSGGFSLDASDLNYPSISAVGAKTIKRTVTNVAPNAAALRFKADLKAADKFHITVSPCEFVLAYGESLTFEIKLESDGLLASSDWMFGSLTWVGYELDAVPNVRPQDSGTSSCTTKGTMTQALGGGTQDVDTTGDGAPTRKRYLRTGDRTGGRTGSVSDRGFAALTVQETTTSPSPSLAPGKTPPPSPSEAPSESPSVSQAPTGTPTLSPSETPTSTPTESLASSTNANADPQYIVYSPIAIKFDLLGEQSVDGSQQP